MIKYENLDKKMKTKEKIKKEKILREKKFIKRNKNMK